MGMFSANDLQQIASSKIDFGDDDGTTTETKSVSEEEKKPSPPLEQPQKPLPSAKPPSKPMVASSESSETKEESSGADSSSTKVQGEKKSLPQGEAYPQPQGVGSAEAEAEAPSEEESFEGRPIEELLKHANWKARKFAYESLEKEHFKEASTGAAFAADIAGIAGEKSMGALDAALRCLIEFTKNCMEPVESDDSKESLQGIVTLLIKKPLVGRTSTKKLASELLLLMAELGKENARLICESLENGLKEKSPKVQQSVLEAIENCVKAFGPAVLPIMVLKAAVLKGLALKLPLVRKQALSLAVTLDVHLQGAFAGMIQAELSNESQRRDMEQAIEKHKGQTPEAPTRSIRGLDAGNAAASGSLASGDAYDFLEAQSILDKVEKMNLEKKMALPKWAERKAALIEVERMCGNPPKLAKGDYSSLVAILRSTIQRDSNQAVVVQVIKLYGVLACGLREDFSSYARAILGTMLARLKDKKLALVSAVEKTLDDLARHCFSLCDDKVIATLNNAFSTNSTPPQRLKIVSFIERSLLKDKAWTDGETNREGFQSILDVACQALEDADSKVREGAIHLFSSIKNRKEPAAVAESVQDTLSGISKRIPRAFAKISKEPSSNDTTQKPKPKPTSTSQRSSQTLSKPKPKPKPTVSTTKPKPSAPEPTKPDLVELMATDAAVAIAQALPGIAEGIAQFDEAEKWQDKVALFEAVSKQVEGCKKETAEALIVFLGSRTRQFKDSNFNLMNKTWDAIGGLLSAKPNEAYVAAFLPAAVSKLGDKKQKLRVAALLLDAVEIYGPSTIISRVVSVVNNGKSGPKVNEEALTFLATSLEQFGGKTMMGCVKEMVDHACGTFGLGAKQMPVKTAASKFLVKAYEHCGERVKKLLGPALDKMQPALDKAIVLGNSHVAARSIRGQEKVVAAPEPDLMGQRKDLTGSFSAELFKQMSDTVSKNSWKIRFKAIDDIVQVFEGANRHVLHNKATGEAVAELKKRLSDSNRNLVAKAIRALGVIGQSVGASSAPSVIRQAGNPLLGCLTDSNKTILSSVFECLTLWCVFDGATETEPFFQLLSQCSTPLCSVKHDRAGLLKLLLQHFPNSATEDDLTQLVKPALSCLQSRDAPTRKSGIKLVSKVVHLLGESHGRELFQASCRDLKPAITRSINPLLQKAYGDAGSGPQEASSNVDNPVHAKPKTLPAREQKKEPRSRRPSSPRGKGRSPPDNRLAGPSEDERNNGPIFLKVDPALKQKRVERGRRKKWPTVIEDKDKGELLADLRHDLEKVVAPRMVNQMFADAQESAAARSFRGAALEPAFKTLLAEIPNSASQVLECLDLILKWTTLHLSSNNSTVTGHVLQLLESIFELCCGADYKLLEVEASAFVPHLVLKLGDKQKRFRECVRNLLRLVCQCYPVSKLVPFLLVELSNRNVYVVSECVDECTLLVDKHGPSLLKLKPLHSKHTMLRSIAQLVGDSRKDVRAAALRFVEAVWELESRDTDKLLKRIAAHKAVLDNKTQTLIQNHLNQSATKAKTPARPHDLPRKFSKAEPKSPQSSMPRTPVTPPLPRKQVGSSMFDVELPTTPPSPNVQSPFPPSEASPAEAKAGGATPPASNAVLTYTPLVSLVERIKCAHLDLADFAHASALDALELLSGGQPPDGCNYSSSEWLHLLAENLDVNRSVRALARELQRSSPAAECTGLVAQALLTISWNRVLASKLNNDSICQVVHASFVALEKCTEEAARVELQKTVQATLVKLSGQSGWFSAVLCRLVESSSEHEREVLVRCIETYIDSQENESDPYLSVDMPQVVEALQRLVVDSQHKGLCESIVRSMLTAGKRFTEHLAPSSTLRVVVARCLLQSKSKNEAAQASDENEKKQPKTEAAAVNVASIRERLGRLRKDYLNISANSPGKATLDSIRARMARQKKA